MRPPMQDWRVKREDERRRRRHHRRRRRRRRRDSRVYNAKLIELIPGAARAAFWQFIMGLRCKYVNQGSNVPRRPSLPSCRRTRCRDSPFPRCPMGAAITSCVNKHSSSGWLSHP